MPNLPRAEEGQRIDLTEWEDLNEVPLLFDEAQNAQHFTDPASTAAGYILDGFQISNPTSKNLRVDLGRAILATRERNVVRKGRLTFEGDNSRTIDLSSFANGTYNVYVRFEYVDGVFQNRIFWNDVSDVEFAKNIPTRRVSNWGLVIAAVAPGVEWLKIGEVEVLASPPLNIHNQRTFYFEGGEFVSVGNSGAAASVGVPGGGVVTVTGLSGMVLASEGRYLHFEGASDPLHNGLFFIRTFNSSSSVDIEVPGGYPGSDANNGSLIWNETRSFEGGWGDGANDRDADRVTHGTHDFHTWAQMVNRKLEEMQGGSVGGSQNPNHRTLRRWDAPINGSLDDKLWLDGALAVNGDAMRGDIEVDTDNSYDFGTTTDRWANVFARQLTVGGGGGNLTIDGGSFLEVIDSSPQIILRDTAEGIASIIFEDQGTPTEVASINFNTANEVWEFNNSSVGVGITRFRVGGSAILEVDDTFDQVLTRNISPYNSTYDFGQPGLRFDTAYLNIMNVNSAGGAGVETDLVPDADNSRDLGNASKFWQAIRCYELHGAANTVLPGTPGTDTLGSSGSPWAGMFASVEMRFTEQNGQITWYEGAGLGNNPRLDVSNTTATLLEVIADTVSFTGDVVPDADEMHLLGGGNYWLGLRTYSIECAAPGAGPTDPGASNGAIQVRWENGAALLAQVFTGADRMFDWPSGNDGVVVIDEPSLTLGSFLHYVTCRVGGSTRYLRLWSAT